MQQHFQYSPAHFFNSQKLLTTFKHKHRKDTNFINYDGGNSAFFSKFSKWLKPLSLCREDKHKRIVVKSNQIYVFCSGMLEECQIEATDTIIIVNTPPWTCAVPPPHFRLHKQTASSAAQPSVLVEISLIIGAASSQSDTPPVTPHICLPRPPSKTILPANLADKKRQMEMDARRGECLMNDELVHGAKHHQSWRAGAEEGPLYLGRDGAAFHLQGSAANQS